MTIQEEIEERGRLKGRQEGIAEAVLKLVEQGAVDALAVKKATGLSVEELQKKDLKNGKIE